MGLLQGKEEIQKAGGGQMGAQHGLAALSRRHGGGCNPGPGSFPGLNLNFFWRRS